jgi:hypothetical protein
MNSIAFTFLSLFSNPSKLLKSRYFFIFVLRFRRLFFAARQYGKYIIALWIDNPAIYDLWKLDSFSISQ